MPLPHPHPHASSSLGEEDLIGGRRAVFALSPPEAEGDDSTGATWDVGRWARSVSSAGTSSSGDPHPPAWLQPAPPASSSPPGRVRRCKRVDFSLTNEEDRRLVCSHWLPDPFDADRDTTDVVVYCHCNSGSRRDAEEALFALLPRGVSVVALDFAGSGLSEGDWVTLGAREVGDLGVVVAFLRSLRFVGSVGLWGRSMGAVTALAYAARDPSIAGVVLDSPFSRLTDLMAEVVEQQGLRLPGPLLTFALGAMRRSVRRRAGFDIRDVVPLDLAPGTFVPALFAHAVGDTFVAPHHSRRLYEEYGGDKNHVLFEGGHNSRRPAFFYHSVAIFFLNALGRADALGRRRSLAGGGGGTALPVEGGEVPYWQPVPQADADSQLTRRRSGAVGGDAGPLHDPNVLSGLDLEWLVGAAARAAERAGEGVSRSSSSGSESGNDGNGDGDVVDASGASGSDDDAVEDVALQAALEASLVEAARERERRRLDGGGG